MLLPSPPLKKNHCTLGRVIVFQISSSVALTAPSYWIKFLCYISPSSLSSPLWHSSHSGTLSKDGFPIRFDLQEPWWWVSHVPDPLPKNSAHLGHSEFSIFVELNLIAIFFQMRRFIMTSWALEDPTEPFLSPNFPKCGLLGTKPARNWDNTWFQMLSSFDLYTGYNML